MDLTQLPEVLEDIILDYVAQIEHKEKFQKTLDTIKTLIIVRTPIGNIRRSTEQIYHCDYNITNNNYNIYHYHRNNQKLITKRIKVIRQLEFGNFFDFFDYEY